MLHNAHRMRALIAFACIALSGVAAAQDQRLQRAQREEEIVWYTAMNVRDAETLLKAFRDRYPFLRLAILRGTGEQVRARILADAQAKRFAWDVVSFNLLDVETLNREGLLAAYASPETKSGFPPGAVDPASRWTAIYVRQYVIAYNTRLVQPEQAPKRWEDLLEPRWTARLALDERDVEWYAAMLDYWGRDKGLRFMRALARQKPLRRQGHQVLTRELAAGEFSLALVHASETEAQKRAGVPVDWVRTLDPTITSATRVAVSAHAPHPAAARLLIDFLLSKEGQLAIRSRGRVPARTDLGAGDATVALHEHFVDPRMAGKLDDYEREFQRLFAQAR
jgi:iron(III) transport system substrate-binding protein